MFTKKQLFIMIGKQGATILAVLVLALFCMNLAKRHIIETEQSIRRFKELSAILESRTETLSNAFREYDAIGNKETRIRAALLPSSNILEFVSILESLALKHNIKQAVKFDSPASHEVSFDSPAREIDKINFVLSLETTVSSLLTYLEDFERLPYFATIQSIGLSAQNTAGWQHTSNISIRGTLYTENDFSNHE